MCQQFVMPSAIELTLLLATKFHSNAAEAKLAKRNT